MILCKNLSFLNVSLGKCEGSRLVGGTRLVVFPRFLTRKGRRTPRAGTPTPLRVVTSPSGRDPPPSLLHLFGKGQGARGPGWRGGPGSWLSRTVSGLGVGIPQAGSPNEPGPLVSPDSLSPSVSPLKHHHRPVDFKKSDLAQPKMLITVRAEISTEFILGREGPVIFKTFLLELIAFRLIPGICPARRAKPENYWKR